MSLPDPAKVTEELPSELRPVFAPLVKRALGLAFGTWCGLVLMVFALIPLLPSHREQDLFVWLLGDNFLYGYRPGALGALVGLLWGFGLGFMAGWSMAFLRNLAISLWILIAGAREQFREDAGHILDEI